jgi:tetratricopeptide (TPR) repeat protein
MKHLRRPRATCSSLASALALMSFALPAGAQEKTSVTFSADVAPLIQKYCAQCHHPGGPGPFDLTTYQTAKLHAMQMATATAARYMPPWQAESDYGKFIGQPHPTEAELGVFRRWAEAGTPEGGPPGRRVEWPTGEWQLGRPDLVLSLPESFTLPAEGKDVFRTFVIPAGIGTVRYIRGLEFLPGNARVVHHANIRIDRTSGSRDLDVKDPGPGYEGLLARTALFPDGHFLGWTPGQVAPLLPADLAWRLEPGSDLVVQLHMQPTGKAEVVNPSIGLFFGAAAPRRHPAMLRLGRQNIDIAPGETAYTVTDAYKLPVDLEVQAVQPHAHYRAREIRGLATLPDGSTRSLISISKWDFRWQHLYRYETPFKLPKGTVVSMRYTYDNSAANPRNPVQPPARALWGQRSAEEMGDLWIQALTASDADLLTLNRDFRTKAVREDLVGYESLIAREPGNVGLHDDAAVLYLELGEIEKAAFHFEATARLTPNAASAHFNLGTMYALLGATSAAVREFESAVAINPQYDKAHHSLAKLRHQMGDWKGAVDSLRSAVALNPEWLAPCVDLAWMLATSPSSDAQARQEAVDLAEKAVRLSSAPDPAVLDTLGVAYAAAGRFADAVRVSQSALAAVPEESLAADIRARLALYMAGKPYQR